MKRRKFKSLGLATDNKASIVAQIITRINTPGIPTATRRIHEVLLDKLVDCKPRKGRERNAPQCGEVHYCPRCNKIHQVKRAKAVRPRFEELIKAGCVAIRFRGAIPCNDELAPNLKVLDDTIDRFVDPWWSKSKKKRQSIWAHVVAGIHTGIHVARDTSSGESWYCHMHALIWINPCDTATLNHVMELLEFHWLSCVKESVNSSFAKALPCYKPRFSPDEKADSAEAAFDYLTKVWSFTDIDLVLPAKETLKKSMVKLTRAIGLSHNRKKFPKQLVRVPLQRKEVMAYMEDQSIAPDRRYQSLPIVICNAPRPPTPVSVVSKSHEGWHKFQLSFGPETRQEREMERARKSRAKARNLAIDNRGCIKRFTRSTQRNTDANTNA